jgi:hypothetical protein
MDTRIGWMTIIFWIWGVLGLIINGMNFLTQTGNVGVGTSAYLAVGNLIWIGGMVLIGVGGILHFASKSAETLATLEATPRSAGAEGRDAVA